MDGFSTIGLSTTPNSPATQTGADADGNLKKPNCPERTEPDETLPEGLHLTVDSAVCDLYENDPSVYADEAIDCRLIKSFDMIFQLHQRSEEIRSHLENIDGLLLKSRTLGGLARRLTTALESEFDLSAARILLRHDHPVAEVFKWGAPIGIGIIPPRLIEHEGLFPCGPFVLDDPNGDLSSNLFGEAAPLLASAVAANLCVDGDELGLLCLGSDDPNRYCGGMNTELIASLADKIALGIKNAWDHECSARESLVGCTDGIYTESFFREYLAKEFNRSWRTGNVFSLLALSWVSTSEAGSVEEIAEQIRANIRSSDVVAQSDTARLWILLPETDLGDAKLVGERLTRRILDEFDQEVMLHFGITSFGRDATAVAMLINRAQAALEEASERRDSNNRRVPPFAMKRCALARPSEVGKPLERSCYSPRARRW